MNVSRSILVIALAACGSPAPAVVQLPVASSASAATAPVSPKLPTTCDLEWSACRRFSEPVRISGTLVGQSPDVAWDGHEALVAFDTPKEGTHVVAVATDGRVLWNELVHGAGAHVAWNARTNSGLVVTSETIAWLGREGKPAHETSAPRVTNVTFAGSPFATESGFLVASGVAGHASNATPMAFSIASLGAPTDAIAWKRVADDGLRGAPIGGPRDAVSWLVSQPRQGAAQLFSVSPSGELGAPIALGNAPTMRATAVDDDRGVAVVLFVDDATHELTVVTVRKNVAAPAQSLGVRSTRSGSAELLRLGAHLGVGADKIGDSPGVAFASFEASRVGAPLAIGPENSQHLRVAATGRGFVAVWNIVDEGGPPRGLSTMLAVYTCCPAPPVR